MLSTLRILHRHLSTSTSKSKSKMVSIPKLSKIPSKYKTVAVREAQKALTDYLHSTRSFPYAYADQIASNSLLSLTNLISKLDFSAPSFSKNFHKLLRYNPINEFEFFFESIGIHYNDVSGLLPPNKFFFSEDATLLHAACALSEFGFPWDKLGKLYMESSSIFRWSAAELKSKLYGFKAYGFCNVQVIGICLAFPFVLREESQQGTVEMDGLFTNLKLILSEFDLGRSVEENVDYWYEICRKIRVIYDLNGEMGEIGELIGRNKNIFMEHGEEELIQKAEYFCRFGAKKEEVARLILQGSELLNLNLETPVINVLKLLKHFGLSSEDLEDVSRNYAYALGTIKMANLPNVMRALGLQEWFFNKVKDGNHQLLVSYITSYPNEEQDKGYRDGLEIIHVSRTPIHNMNKLNFLHALGFGENALTMNVFTHLHGTSSELQKRFECLLHSGIEFSKLCKLITMHPKILRQNPKIIEQKINFLCQEMGTSLDLLDTFPGLLCFDLENRIKPRYRFHMWIIEKGLSTRNYSIASMIATSNKNFVARAFKIHPAAPKHWFEQFLAANC